jgi:UDP-N-acetylglucosamine--N-acetylmuramyl-(pentapeptide) pyrophosphoryl-undecaprenol N-acetylglucosamine transferase
MGQRGWNVHLATDERAEQFAGDFPATEVHSIASATIGSRNPVALLGAFWTIWRGVRQSSEVIRRITPDVVVGFGGYPTVPPLYAATRRNVPTVIHEQNAVMGRANRALARRVNAVAGGFLGQVPEHLRSKTTVTGNPVRPAVIEAAATPYVPSGPGQTFRLVVFGGSQGAQFFSDVVPAALARLGQDHRERLEVTHQARAEDVSRVMAAFAELGIEAKVQPFFTDMARRIAAAHLVISRSGASTVSEIAVIGRPAFLVPYPHALDHDQAANAAALAAAGGAEVHRQSSLSADRLADLIGTAMQEPERLARMAAAARSAGRPDAARLLADLAEAISSGQSVAEWERRRA